MENNDINHAKKVVFKGLILLAIITLVEVFIALLGNGHLIEGVHLSKWIMYPLMIGLSLYKAYFIIYEFMHLKYEMQGLRLTVLMPMLLLVWAVIAFFNEGSNWKHNRQVVQQKNQIGIEQMATPPAPAAHGEEAAPANEH